MTYLEIFFISINIVCLKYLNNFLKKAKNNKQKGKKEKEIK